MTTDMGPEERKANLERAAEDARREEAAARAEIAPKRRRGPRMMTCPKCEGAGKVPRPRKPKPPSRADRWSDAASRAQEALNELKELQDEAQSWYDALPEGLQQSATGEALDAICQVDLDSATSAADDAAGASFPLGYGRD